MTSLCTFDRRWENQMTNEEKKAARRKRRAELGQDLFSTQARASANSLGEISRRILPANSLGEFSRRILSAGAHLGASRRRRSGRFFSRPNSPSSFAPFLPSTASARLYRGRSTISRVSRSHTSASSRTYATARQPRRRLRHASRSPACDG